MRITPSMYMRFNIPCLPNLYFCIFKCIPHFIYLLKTIWRQWWCCKKRIPDNIIDFVFCLILTDLSMNIFFTKKCNCTDTCIAPNSLLVIFIWKSSVLITFYNEKKRNMRNGKPGRPIQITNVSLFTGACAFNISRV